MREEVDEVDDMESGLSEPQEGLTEPKERGSHKIKVGDTPDIFEYGCCDANAFYVLLLFKSDDVGVFG